MGFDEEGWVARYVAMGGDEAQGRATAAKMREAQDTAAPAAAASALKGARASYSPLKPASSLLGITAPAAAPAPSTPPAPTPPVQAALPAPVAATENADLFGDKPPQTPPPAARRGITKTTPATKRGRKPVAFDDKARNKSQQELDLFHLSMEIEEKNAKETGDLGFLATAMIYASLPHSEVEGAVFKRRNGAHTLTILNDPEIGLPYGKIPRIITAFLCTEAKRYAETRGREIHLGHSQAEFMEKLGLRSTGGERGDISRVRDQAKRLFTSNISPTGDAGSQFHWESVRITRKGMMLWNPQNIEERAPWQSKLMLTEEFFDECICHSVPVDLRVLHKLRSPLAIDIYVWLTYRYNSIAVPTPVTWKQLQWQFGSNYPNTPQGERDFKANFKKQLRNVMAVYREAKMDVRQDVLMLLPSPPHILPNAS